MFGSGWKTGTAKPIIKIRLRRILLDLILARLECCEVVRGSTARMACVRPIDSVAVQRTPTSSWVFAVFARGEHKDEKNHSQIKLQLCKLMASFEYEFDFMDGSNQKTSGLLCKAPGGLSCSTIHYLEPIRKLVMKAHSPEDQSTSEINESKPVVRLLCPTSTQRAKVILPRKRTFHHPTSGRMFFRFQRWRGWF